MAEYTAEMAHAAAVRGAKWLDKNCPDWFREIDLDRLDLMSPVCCVLGQTANCILGRSEPGNDYWSVVRLHGFSPEAQDRWAASHGFKGPNADLIGPIYEMLTIAWREYIRMRLEVAP